MKAVLWTKYGPPEGLRIGEIDTPKPKDNEILIRIRCTTVTAGDCEMRSLTFRFPLPILIRLYAGLLRPRRITVLGQEIAGEVEAVGNSVTRFAVGDRVFGQTDFSMGGYAEYRTFPAEPGEDEGIIAAMPSNMTFEEAAGVPLGGLEALMFLREAAVQNGEHVLIIGSGGSIGTMALQIAKHHGAEVTAVDSSAKLEMLQSLGADHVIDYMAEPVEYAPDGYDVIFDVVGKGSLSRKVALLKDGGRLLLSNPGFGQAVRGTRTLRSRSKKVVAGVKSRGLEDLLTLKDLIEAGHIGTVIDKKMSLDEIVEAHRYVESGQKRGSLIITVA